jgi:uncharacterized membrane protein HdeD (DUF308 family)
MEYLIMGILFIGIGILVRFFPNLLAGYSSLSQREKENAQINHLPTITSLIFGAMGILFIAGHFASIVLDQPELKSTVGMIVILLGVISIVIVGNVLVNRRM